MRIVGLIPARGGSKGLPGKNTRPLLGRSPIQRAYECALASGACDRVLLSTDDRTTMEHALTFGLEAPFLRPASLALDDTPMIAVVCHALEYLLDIGYSPDAVLLLQPTSPLRRPAHIVRAVSLLDPHDSVCSVVQIPPEYTPHYLMRVDDSGNLRFFLAEGVYYTRRQDAPQLFRRDGTVYLTRVTTILEERSLYGSYCKPMILQPDESVTIDSPEDWVRAEGLLRNQGLPAASML
jgi:N-acylneuraminate cytidylyltransferase